MTSEEKINYKVMNRASNYCRRIKVKNPDDTASVTVTLKKDEVAFCITKRILGINFNVMTTVYSQEAVEIFKTLGQRK